MEQLSQPGTINDLIADAARHGHEVIVRLVRDWSERGLLDYPTRRAAGKGHGSKPALYTANQRMLFLALLDKRVDSGIRSLARMPVWLWMYWGDDYVPLRQARRAFMTWLDDPRVSKQRAKETARAILGQLDHPAATDKARRELVDLLTGIGYTGKVDFDQLDRAVRAVFQPGSVRIERALGHPSAPITAESVVGVIRARLAAIKQLHANQVSDSLFIQARQAQLITFAEYTQQQPTFAASAPQHLADIYEPPTAEMALNGCCSHLLTTIGMHICYPDAAAKVLASPPPVWP